MQPVASRCTIYTVPVQSTSWARRIHSTTSHLASLKNVSCCLPIYACVFRWSLSFSFPHQWPVLISLVSPYCYSNFPFPVFEVVAVKDVSATEFCSTGLLALFVDRPTYPDCRNRVFITRIRSALNLTVICYLQFCIRDSSVGKATRYGLEGPGIESQCGRDFPHISRPAPRPTQLPVQWVPGLSRGKGGRGVVLTTHPHLVCRGSRKTIALYLFSLRRLHGL